MIDLINISLQFGGKYLFRDVNYKINDNSRISLVGANGTGKTSLFKIITGELAPEAGYIQMRKKTSIGYLPQDHVTHSGSKLFEEVFSALRDIVSLKEAEEEITEALTSASLTEDERSELVAKLGETHHLLEAMDSYRAGSRVEKILIGLGFRESDFYRSVDEFSGGWQMRIALAKLLIANHDLLLLDEPTNHLDIDSLNWLIEFLTSYQGALIIISHDKFFVNKVTNKTLEIFLNKISSFNGNYDAYIKYKEERDLQAEHQFELQQKKLKDTQKFIERFRYKASKARQVQSRIKQIEKVELVELPQNSQSINFRFPEAPPGGKTVIELKNICKSFGSFELFRNVNITVDRGDKIAFLGPNGAGKSTLAKIIAGVINHDSGSRIPGHNIQLSYYSQEATDILEPTNEVIDAVADVDEEVTLASLRALLGTFLFSGDDVFKKISVLSGGEKSRVALVRILLTKANFIILDEPTNHLDITSKKVLQQALINFTGSLIVVSHDVDFLEPIANKIIDIRHGELRYYPGGISYYLDKRKEEQQEESRQTVNNLARDEKDDRKSKKRLEAELRQKRYSLTKDLKKTITKLESDIEKSEAEKKELELQMADPESTLKANFKDLGIRYNQIESVLTQKISEWEKLCTELEEIEKEFS
ncbi:MAG: ABC-F family ATP-binding cassette domain-containing protein [Ignavibacteriaceae bacterium]|nr:ABC-F family ATP-binding cassette domain-containing protein [Ignavibacteriaceae bacterium]